MTGSLLQRGGRFGLFLILLLSVGATGFILAGPGDADPAPKTDVTALLPASTLLHIAIDGGPCEGHGQELALARILDEPEIQAFLAPLEKPMRKMAEESSSKVEKMLGVSVEELLKLFNQRTTISLLGLDPVEQNGRQTVMPDVVLTVEFGKELEVVRRLIKAFEELVTEQWQATIEPTKLAGVPATYVKAEGPVTIEAWYAVENGLLMLGSKKSTMEGMLTRLKSGSRDGSLAADADYAETHRNAVRKNTILELYVNVRRGMQLAESFGLWEQLDRQSATILKMMDLSKLHAFGMGLDLDGPGFRDRFYVHMPKGHSLFDALMSKESGTLASLSVAPSDAAGYVGGRIDMAGLYEWAMDMVGKIDEGMVEEVEDGVAQFEQGFGFSLQKDLLANLGPEFAMYLAFPGSSLVPDIALMAQVKDAAKIRKILDGTVETLGGQVEFRDFKYLGQKITYVDVGAMLGDGGFGPRWTPQFKPSWLLVNDFLVVTGWPQTAKNLIHGLKNQRPRLAQRPDFKSLLAHLKNESPAAGSASVSYFDMKALAGFVLDNGIPFAQSMIPRIEEFPVDFAAFPVTDTITKHLFGMIGASERRKEGIYAEYYSPTGYFVPYVTMVGVMAAVVARNQFGRLEAVRAMEAERAFAEAEHHRARAMQDVQALKNCVKLFTMKEGRLPRESEWPSFLFMGSRNHPNAYLDPSRYPNKVVKDPWGNPYQYKLHGGRRFEIQSLGADGAPGGNGAARDISSMRGGR